MSLSNSTSVQIVQPISGQSGGQFSVFSIPDDHVLSDIPLICGVYAPQVTGTTSALYPAITGVMSSVQKLEIKSGTTTLDVITDFSTVSSITAVSTTNAGSRDYNRFVGLNGWGFTESEDGSATINPGALTLQSANVDYFNTCNAAIVVNNQINIPATATQQSGMINLRDVSPFLQSLDVLPCIPNMTIEVTWDTNPATYFNDPTRSVVNFQPFVINPTLVLTRKLGMKRVTDVQFNFRRTVIDSFSVPAVTNTYTLQPLTTSYISQSFTKKQLRRLTFYNLTNTDLAAADRWLTKPTRSPAMKDEVINFYVNDNEVIPPGGIYSPALKYHFYNETYQPLNLPLAAAMPTVADQYNSIFSTETQALVGQFSVTAYPINVPVVYSLRVQTQRTYQPTAGLNWQNDPYRVLLVGEVECQYIMTTGKDGLPVVTIRDYPGQM